MMEPDVLGVVTAPAETSSRYDLTAGADGGDAAPAATESKYPETAAPEFPAFGVDAGAMLSRYDPIPAPTWGEGSAAPAPTASIYPEMA